MRSKWAGFHQLRRQMSSCPAARMLAVSRHFNAAFARFCRIFAPSRDGARRSHRAIPPDPGTRESSTSTPVQDLARAGARDLHAPRRAGRRGSRIWQQSEHAAVGGSDRPRQHARVRLGGCRDRRRRRHWRFDARRRRRAPDCRHQTPARDNRRRGHQPGRGLAAHLHARRTGVRAHRRTGGQMNPTSSQPRTTSKRKAKTMKEQT